MYLVESHPAQVANKEWDRKFVCRSMCLVRVWWCFRWSMSHHTSQCYSDLCYSCDILTTMLELWRTFRELSLSCLLKDNATTWIDCNQVTRNLRVPNETGMVYSSQRPEQLHGFIRNKIPTTSQHGEVATSHFTTTTSTQSSGSDPHPQKGSMQSCGVHDPT